MSKSKAMCFIAHLKTLKDVTFSNSFLVLNLKIDLALTKSFRPNKKFQALSVLQANTFFLSIFESSFQLTLIFSTGTLLDNLPELKCSLISVVNVTFSQRFSKWVFFFLSFQKLYFGFDPI